MPCTSQCNGDCFCLVSIELSRQCRCDARRIWKMKGAESEDLFNCTYVWLKKKRGGGSRVGGGGGGWEVRKRPVGVGNIH